MDTVQPHILSRRPRRRALPQAISSPCSNGPSPASSRTDQGGGESGPTRHGAKCAPVFCAASFCSPLDRGAPCWPSRCRGEAPLLVFPAGRRWRPATAESRGHGRPSTAAQRLRYGGVGWGRPVCGGGDGRRGVRTSSSDYGGIVPATSSPRSRNYLGSPRAQRRRRTLGSVTPAGSSGQLALQTVTGLLTSTMLFPLTVGHDGVRAAR